VAKEHYHVHKAPPLDTTRPAESGSRFQNQSVIFIRILSSHLPLILLHILSHSVSQHFMYPKVYCNAPLVHILSQINPIHTTPSYSSKIRLNSIYTQLGLPSGLFPSGFPTNIPYAINFSPFDLHAQPISPSSIGPFQLHLVKSSSYGPPHYAAALFNLLSFNLFSFQIFFSPPLLNHYITS
jgi:hypothetical protein